VNTLLKKVHSESASSIGMSAGKVGKPGGKV
jgi:hypothetical protein